MKEINVKETINNIINVINTNGDEYGIIEVAGSKGKFVLTDHNFTYFVSTTPQYSRSWDNISEDELNCIMDALTDEYDVDWVYLDEEDENGSYDDYPTSDLTQMVREESSVDTLLDVVEGYLDKYAFREFLMDVMHQTDNNE